MTDLTDSRYRTKVYLDTYLTAANLTEDNGSDLASFFTMYAYPPYPLRLLFLGELNYDLIFFVDKPTAKARYSAARIISGYEESIPVHVHAVDKTGLTAEKVLWKAEIELRDDLLEYPFGSLRRLSETKDHTIREGSSVFYGFTIVLSYLRDTST